MSSLTLHYAATVGAVLLVFALLAVVLLTTGGQDKPQTRTRAAGPDASRPCPMCGGDIRVTTRYDDYDHLDAADARRCFAIHTGV